MKQHLCCPRLKPLRPLPWDIDHCGMRFEAGQYFEDNECKDCMTYLKAYLEERLGV